MKIKKWFEENSEFKKKSILLGKIIAVTLVVIDIMSLAGFFSEEKMRGDVNKIKQKVYELEDSSNKNILNQEKAEKIKAAQLALYNNGVENYNMAKYYETVELLSGITHQELLPYAKTLILKSKDIIKKNMFIEVYDSIYSGQYGKAKDSLQNYTKIATDSDITNLIKDLEKIILAESKTENKKISNASDKNKSQDFKTDSAKAYEILNSNIRAKNQNSNIYIEEHGIHQIEGKQYFVFTVTIDEIPAGDSCEVVDANSFEHYTYYSNGDFIRR